MLLYIDPPDAGYRISGGSKFFSGDGIPENGIHGIGLIQLYGESFLLTLPLHQFFHFDAGPKGVRALRKCVPYPKACGKPA